MRIAVDSEIGLTFAAPTPLVWMLRLHPSVDPAVRVAETATVEPPVPVREYVDLYGNRCGRALAPAGLFTVRTAAVVEDGGEPDRQSPDAAQHPVEELPDETLLFLLASRYCEVDGELQQVAQSEFAGVAAGWPLVQAACDFAHRRLTFDYQKARATRTAAGAYRERVGVCRDFAHLAVTLCRCLNVPARYCTGYLGDIGVPPAPDPMDFSAWFEVYLGGRWHTFDARHNVPRIGRVLVARGRDAADVALTTTFGAATLTTFKVGTAEV